MLIGATIYYNPNGFNNDAVAPLLVTVKLLVELSVRKASATVFNNKDVCVPVTAEMFVPALCVAASGAVGTVNAPVYTATPLTARKFDR